MISHLTRVEITDDDGQQRSLDELEIAGFSRPCWPRREPKPSLSWWSNCAAVIFADNPGE